jgi:hypothetical protein
VEMVRSFTVADPHSFYADPDPAFSKKLDPDSEA